MTIEHSLSLPDAISTTRAPLPDAFLIVDDALFNCPTLEEHERLWAGRHFLPSHSGQIHPALKRSPVRWEFMHGQRIHVILAVDRLNVLIEAEFRVVNDVEELLSRTHASNEGRML